MSTSRTTINRRPHPGKWLKTEMMDPVGLTQYRLAKDLGVAQSLVLRLINGQAHITAALAVRLAAYYGNSAEFWLNLQQNYDLAEPRATVDTSGIHISQQQPEIQMSAADPFPQFGRTR